MYEGLNEKQNQNHAISTSKNELFFVIVPKIVKSKKKCNFSKVLEKLEIFSEIFPIFPEKFPRLRTLQLLDKNLQNIFDFNWPLF